MATDRAHNLEALQVAISARQRGYCILRKPFAKRIDTDADDLDKRVAAMVRSWFEAMAEPPATRDSDAGSRRTSAAPIKMSSDASTQIGLSQIIFLGVVN